MSTSLQTSEPEDNSQDWPRTIQEALVDPDDASMLIIRALWLRLRH